MTIFNTLRKRLSNGITKSVNVTVAEDDGLEKLKKAALKGLGEKIIQHLISGAMVDGDVAGLNAVFKPVIANINVARLGPAERRPLVARRMALSLSYLIMLLETVYPWASIKV